MKWWIPALVAGLMSCTHAATAADGPPPPPPPDALESDPVQEEAVAPVQGETVVRKTPEELQQLVAPIALYPDELVAQILAASTYPTQIVEADRWVQQHPDLKGEPLAQAVDQEPWDGSVKAVAQFPSVLGNMDKNLSWTSALGDAYVNQPQEVMNAVQSLRKRAQQAGNLETTPQATVSSQGETIVIEPASPTVVYVPVYDPWVVYGPPLVAWPAWYWYPGLYAVGPRIAFSVGFGIGFWGGFGWGWHHWGADWHHHHIWHDHHRWVSHSRTFIDHHHFYRGGPGVHGAHGFHGEHGFHGGPAPRGPMARTHTGAFSGSGHGGITASHSAHPQSSFRGGFHGGGGGFHGGGGHR